jgi:TolB-like protein/Tfp pilus assembly protein PilF
VRRALRAATSLPPARAASFVAIAILVLTGVATIREPLVNPSPTPVVIRPFANLTRKPELEYLAIGTAGELRRRLSRVPTVRVYTADSGGTGSTAASATYLIQGHIQEADGLLRITVELTDATEGTLVWSQNFDGEPNQALHLEDRLAAETVGALARQRRTGAGPRDFGFLAGLFPQPRPSVPPSGTSSSAAFDFYLRGRTLFEERTLPAALQAIEYLERAVREDPNYAAAYATLADVQGVLMDAHYAPHSTLLENAERYAAQAVALDPEQPDAQLSLAAVRQAQWRWGEAEAAYRRAIELHPTFARAHRWYGGLLLQFGRFEESLALYRTALDLDPLDYPSQSAYGHALFNAGRAFEAERQLERVLTMKDLPNAHALLGQVYAFRVREEPGRAREYLQKALEHSEILRQKAAADSSSQEPGAWTHYADLIAALAWSYAGDHASAAPYVARLEAGRSAGQVAPSVLARVYAAQGNDAAAVAALAEAEQQRDRELLYINVSPHYASIRDDAQFRALVQRLGLSR